VQGSSAKGISSLTDKRTVLWLWKNTGRCRCHIGWLVLLHILVSGGAVCYALVMKKMIDCAIVRNEEGFFSGLLSFVGIVVIQSALRMILRYLEEYTRSGLENTFKEKLFALLLKKNYVQVSAMHSEEWMNRMTSDTMVCGSGMTEILPGFLGMAVRMIGAILMIFILQPQLAYIMLLSGVFFIGLTLVLRKYLKVFHKDVQEKDGVVRMYLQERISSMLVLRTFGVEERALTGAGEVFDGHKKARMKKAVVSNFANTGFAMAVNGMYLLGIGYCGYGILNGVVSYGTLTAIMQLIGQLQVPLSGISGFVPRFYAMLASAERLMEIESYEDADSVYVKSLEETRELYKTKIEEIIFDKVSFDYIDNDESSLILQEVSIALKKGDYVAITGESGCGKSTLLKLLMGIYEPKSGQIEVLLQDGNKVPIKELKRLFAYVPQGNYLMSGTIREVITFGKEIVTEGSMTMEEALKIACGEFVFDLPDGIDSMLGEKGTGLSEGQMQRIAIARALYANTPVLILDESTSALDEETEKRVLENLKQLTDKTVFFVTHRTETLKICNKKICFTREGILLKGK